MILDVGSGYRPWKEADIFLDAYHDNSSRKANLVIPNGKEFIYADVRKLPFANKIFDYVRCNHTLEHIEEGLDLACEELMRVGGGGFIGLPNYSYDLMSGRPYHYWWCFIDGDELIFVSKNTQGSVIDDYVRSLPDMKGGINLEWKDRFKYRIIKLT